MAAMPTSKPSVLPSRWSGAAAETSVEVIGAESQFGAARRVGRVREVDVKIAAKHPSPKGIGILLKEMVGMALTAPPGLTAFAGSRPRPSPVVRLFSLLVPKDQVAVSVSINGRDISCNDEIVSAYKPQNILFEAETSAPGEDAVTVTLESLAWGRSGDKGSKANIGVIARDPAFVPYIAAQLTPEYVADAFGHFLEPDQAFPVERFYLPGIHAFNFLLHDVLGGGGIASLRTDPQGKGYAQLLLTHTIAIPRTLAETFNLPPCA